MDDNGGKVSDAVWGANPDDPKTGTTEEEAPRVGAENVWLKMPTSDGKMIEITLLQALNQVFCDMGHIDMRLRALEGEEEESKIVTV